MSNALPGVDVEAEGASVVAARVDAQLKGLDEELVRLERAVAVGAMQRAEYQKVLAALGRDAPARKAN